VEISPESGEAGQAISGAIRNIFELPMAVFSPHGEGLVLLRGLFSRSFCILDYIARMRCEYFHVVVNLRAAWLEHSARCIGFSGHGTSGPIELGQPRTLRVAMNLREDFRPNLGEGDWTFPAPRLRSGRVMFSKETVRRVGIERCQSRIEAETRPAVGTEDRVRPAHLDVDVRVVLRWGHADALELPDADADFRAAAVIPELRMAAVGHRLSLL
jgi:hypothetical protein